MLKISPNGTGSPMTNVKTSGVKHGVSGDITPIEEENLSLASFIIELGESGDFGNMSYRY